MTNNQTVYQSLVKEMQVDYNTLAIECSEHLFNSLKKPNSFNSNKESFVDELKNILFSGNFSSDSKYSSYLIKNSGSTELEDYLLLIKKSDITLVFDSSLLQYYILDEDFNFIYGISNLNNSISTGFSIETETHIYKPDVFSFKLKEEKQRVYYSSKKHYEGFHFSNNAFVSNMSYFISKEVYEVNFNSSIKKITFDSRLNLKSLEFDLDLYEKLKPFNIDKITFDSYSNFIDKTKDYFSLIELESDTSFKILSEKEYNDNIIILKKTIMDKKSYHQNKDLFKLILNSVYPLSNFSSKINHFKLNNKEKYDNDLEQENTLSPQLFSILTFLQIINKNIDNLINKEYIKKIKAEKTVVRNIKI